MSENTSFETIIVGSGISGLTIANELIAKGQKREDILVIEAADRHGGLVKTQMKDGYLSEGGPEGLRGNLDDSYHVFELAGLEPIEVSEESKLRFLVHKGKLKKVPTNPISAIFSPLIPFFGKFRILKEPFVKKMEGNETIEEFMKRRLGKGILPIIDAFVSGIHGGDYRTLSISHAFTILKEYEIAKGSIVRGAIASSKEKKRLAKERGEEIKKKKKAPFLITSDGGMTGLINGLAKNVDIKYSSPVQSINKAEGEYEIETIDQRFTANRVILATGVNGTQKISINNEEPLASTLESFVNIVSLGFDQSAFDKPVKGYGFLSPSREETFVLGVLFTSRLFADHAPDDKVLLRCFVGGIRHPEHAQLSDEELIQSSLGDIRKLMNVQGDPEFAEVTRNQEKGIPQMLMGHEKYVDWKTQIESKNENLHLIGLGWNEISCSGLIREARELVDQISDSQP